MKGELKVTVVCSTQDRASQNTNEAKFGGFPERLSQAAPQAARSLIRSLKTLTENEEYEVTLECTHHGPSDLDVPSV